MAVFLAQNAKNTAISGSIRYIGQVIKPEVIPLPSLSVAELVEAMSVKAGAEAIPCPVPLDLLGERTIRRPSLSVAELVEAMSVKAGAEAIPCPVPLDLLGERTIRRPSLSVAELVEARVFSEHR